MEKENLKKLKQISNKLSPQFNLGKSGITQSFIKTIEDYLEVHNIVKIKVLIAEDKDSLSYYAEEIAKETQAEIVEKKGFTFTLFKS